VIEQPTALDELVEPSGSEDLPEPLPPPRASPPQPLHLAPPPQPLHRAPPLQPPHLSPLLQLPELQGDGAPNPLLIAAGQFPAVNARWMTRTHFALLMSASTRGPRPLRQGRWQTQCQSRTHRDDGTFADTARTRGVYPEGLLTGGRRRGRRPRASRFHHPSRAICGRISQVRRGQGGEG
jgi:hypothetical protein